MLIKKICLPKLNYFTYLTTIFGKQGISSLISNENHFKVAIIGSGPSGFYTGQQLLKYPHLEIDIYEKYPVPFGLVRFGVAPDHQEAKNVINSFTKVAKNDRTRFIGNIDIGNDVTFQEIRNSYHAVVLCYGSSQDALLNIPGEKEFSNILSARRFVGWYNGIPEDKDLELSLKGNTAVIIGQGNVALDCARILLTPLNILKKTDITKHACKQLEQSNINKVIIVGRRGPLQAAFKIKEFRELTKICDCHVKFDLSDFPVNQLDINDNLIETLPRSRRRIVELYKKIIEESNIEKNSTKECVFKFLLSPINILHDGKISKPSIKSVQFKKNILDNYINEDSKIIETEKTEKKEIQCDILIRSIGFKATSIDPSLPFDDRRGIILNKDGRVLNSPGIYCSGWAAFGSTGVIVNTMNISFEVGKNIIDDIESGMLKFDPNKKGYEQIHPLLVERNSKMIDFIDWQHIDQFEKELGQKEGKPREKLVSVDKILNLAK